MLWQIKKLRKQQVAQTCSPGRPESGTVVDSSSNPCIGDQKQSRGNSHSVTIIKSKVDCNSEQTAKITYHVGRSLKMLVEDQRDRDRRACEKKVKDENSVTKERETGLNGAIIKKS
jgi:hypothetical protein